MGRQTSGAGEPTWPRRSIGRGIATSSRWYLYGYCPLSAETLKSQAYPAQVLERQRSILGRMR